MVSSDKPDIEQLKQKLYEKLGPSGWSGVLKGFILSSEMDRVFETLIQESEAGLKFTPRLNQLFRAFYECPYENLKVIILLQDPYPYLSKSGTPVADGIPMSCSNTGMPEASLKYVWGAIKETCYKEENWRGPLDLKRWSNQGVLLLNIALTTTVGKTGVHYNLWKPFILYLLDYLSWHNGGLIYQYLGKKAQSFMSATNNNCYKLTASHPASAGYAHLDYWESDGIFKKTNDILKKDKKEIIKW